MQYVFGWFEDMVGQRSRVRRLLRFNPSGSLATVTYGQWLAFYTPLSANAPAGGAS